MTKKIIDLEGRLDAALKRDEKKTRRVERETIGRYRMADCPGRISAEIIFCRLIGPDGISQWVVWDRTLINGACYHGHYSNNFREGLKDFLRRVEADGARS